MLLRCCAACPPSGSPRATAHRSVRFVSVRVSAFCPPYDSARAEQLKRRGAGGLSNQAAPARQSRRAGSSRPVKTGACPFVGGLRRFEGGIPCVGARPYRDRCRVQSLSAPAFLPPL